MTAKIRWNAANQNASRSRRSYGPVPDWPQSLLDRYRASTLKPGEAKQGIRPPAGTTVYRTAFLLIPDYAIGTPSIRSPRRFMARYRKEAKPADGDLFGILTKLFAEIGVGVKRPLPLDKLVPDPALRRHLSRLPRPVPLIEQPAGPPVDAWRVLQDLRGLIATRDFGPDTKAMQGLADEIALDHLVCGAVLGYGGVPTYDPNGVHETAGSNSFSPEGRFPVEFLAAEPKRAANLSTRRPVIAVLDTGVRNHPWFGNLGPTAAGQPSTFLHLHTPTQEAINAQQVDLDLRDADILRTYLDEPVFEDAIGEVLNPAIGHGTFIAGVIHQTEPDADVLMLRVLRPDNIGKECAVLVALWLILARIREAKAHNRTEDMVDILSLSIGYYDENPDEGKRARLTEVIDALITEGVVIVASAGNESTDRPFLPAALASFGSPSTGQPVIGVGALNPNGTTAWFSNGGVCAACLAPGAVVISTFPPDVRGSAGPTRITGSRQRLDVDDFRSGFAAWSGSSFAAPYVAARIAKAMLGQNLDDIRTQTSLDRGADAVAGLR